jgi:SAM-dependent methyltransferase
VTVSEVPNCPITGLPARRHVQWITTRLLTDLWRIEMGADIGTAFAGLDRFGLWESPTGLYFFDPLREGDHAFYAQCYKRINARKLFSAKGVRHEFEMAARRIAAGSRVLDVGCGFASFKPCVPHARYTGLDPNFAPKATDPRVDADIRPQSLAEHLVEHAGTYDAVCAFQVIEHVSTPTVLFEQMVQATRPGGRVIVGVPKFPSMVTRIPNFILNAPPHHLTWWTSEALAALAKKGGTIVESIETVPWGGYDSLAYWIERCSPIKCDDVHYRGAWSWHGATLVGLALGHLVHALRGTPRTDDEGPSLLLVARRPE